MFFCGLDRLFIVWIGGAIILLRIMLKGNPPESQSFTGAIMSAAEMYLSEDEDRRELIGILHDIESKENHEDMARQEIRGAEILIGAGLDLSVPGAISRHYPVNAEGYVPVNRVIRAADNLSGLVITCALVKGESLSPVTPDTIRGKIKDKSLATCNRKKGVKMTGTYYTLPAFFDMALRAAGEIRQEFDSTKSRLQENCPVGITGRRGQNRVLPETSASIRLGGAQR